MAESLCAETYTISWEQPIALPSPPPEVPISNRQVGLSQIFVCCVFNEAIAFKCSSPFLPRLFKNNVSLYTQDRECTCRLPSSVLESSCVETFSCALKEIFCLPEAKGVEIKFLFRPGFLPTRFSLPTKRSVCACVLGEREQRALPPPRVGFAGGRGGGEESADVNGSVLNLDAKSA